MAYTIVYEAYIDIYSDINLLELREDMEDYGDPKTDMQSIKLRLRL